MGGVGIVANGFNQTRVPVRFSLRVKNMRPTGLATR